MSFIIAIVFVPIYVVVSIVSLFFARYALKEADESKYNGFSIFKLEFFGFALSLIVTWIVFYNSPKPGFEDVHEIFVRVGITIFTPLVIVVIFSILFWKNNGFKYFSVGALLSGLVMPWLIFFLAAFNFNVITNFPLFWYACRGTETVIHENVSPADSVYVPSDLSDHQKRPNERKTESFSKYLLNQSLLEFVEYPVVNSGENGDFGITKLSTQGARRLSYRSKTKKRTSYITQLRQGVSSEYAISAIRLDYPDVVKTGIEGSRVEILRRSDAKVIAYTQFYRDRKAFRSCPSKVNLFDFVVTALNVVNVSRGH